MGRCDLVIDMAKPFCVCTNLSEYYHTGTVISPLPSCQRTHLGQTTFAALCVRGVRVHSHSPFHPSPSTFHSWLSSLCFAQTGEVGCQKHHVVLLGSGSGRQLSTHYTGTVLGQGRDSLLKIHKTIAEINIFPF